MGLRSLILVEGSPDSMKRPLFRYGSSRNSTVKQHTHSCCTQGSARSQVQIGLETRISDSPLLRPSWLTYPTS